MRPKPSQKKQVQVKRPAVRVERIKEDSNKRRMMNLWG